MHYSDEFIVFFFTLIKYFKSRISKNTFSTVKNPVQPYNSRVVDKYRTLTCIIPTRDRIDLLKPCVDSIFDQNGEIAPELIVIDNDSREEVTKNYFDDLRTRGVKIIESPGHFDYAKMINLAVLLSSNENIVLCNNDIVLRSKNVLSELTKYLTSRDVGVVGSLLLNPNGTIQHFGLAMGAGGIASNIYDGHEVSSIGEYLRNDSVHQVPAVTFALAAFRKQTFETLGGLDTRLKVGLNDVDFCVRTKQLGLKILLVTDVDVLHWGSASRGSSLKPTRFFRAASEVLYFLKKYGQTRN